MITMKDINREGNPTLRAVAEVVPVPITEEDRHFGEDMLTFLKISQDPVKAEVLKLRGGVGL
ncbi:peptide deformylase, partial [Enterococcus faecalis]